jgi:hypothetical protein
MGSWDLTFTHPGHCIAARTGKGAGYGPKGKTAGSSDGKLFK